MYLCMAAPQAPPSMSGTGHAGSQETNKGQHGLLEPARSPRPRRDSDSSLKPRPSGTMSLSETSKSGQLRWCGSHPNGTVLHVPDREDETMDEGSGVSTPNSYPHPTVMVHCLGGMTVGLCHMQVAL
jgi:hypothetical protein